MFFTRPQAKSFYDHFGSKQDAQAFYEDKALDDLVAHAAFEQAERVFEFGFGTGRFAFRLLEKHLPAAASYFGIDLSSTMTGLAEQRIAPYAGRAKVVQSDGSISFPVPDHSVDRVVSNYVLDLLPESDIREVVSESHRVLKPGGKLCLVSLTPGMTFASRMVCAWWSAAFRLHAPLVGGCRPVRLESFFDQQTWLLDYRQVVTQFGVPSEVLVASPKVVRAAELR